MESKTKSIFQSIPLIMNAVGAIPKSQKNAQQGYNFRGIDDVYNALNKALSDNGVFIVPTVMERTLYERQTKSGGNMYHVFLKVQFRFYASDGSYVEAITEGEAMDSGDKATNKAQSAAFKYACMELFCIPTKELLDADAETQPETVTTKQPETVKATTQVKAKPELSDNDKRAAIPAAVANLKDIEALNVFWVRCQPLMTEDNEAAIKDLFTKKAKEFGALYSNQENKFLCYA